MAGSLRVGMVVLALIAGAGSADAFGGGGWWGGRAAYSCSFYPAYPAPMYGPAYHVPRGAPCEFLPPAYPPPPPTARPSKERPAKERPAKERSQPLVKPIPKDAKKTSEPPIDARRAPIVTESRSLGGAFAEPVPTMPQGMARVGFWNVTGRDVTLSIDGRQRALPKDRAITVNLERSFTWQVNDGALQTERVPVDQRSFEVIIRP